MSDATGTALDAASDSRASTSPVRAALRKAVTVDRIDANGRSSVLVLRDAPPVAWLTVSATGGEGIDRIHCVLNPAKLTRIAAAVQNGGAED